MPGILERPEEVSVPTVPPVAQPVIRHTVYQRRGLVLLPVLVVLLVVSIGFAVAIGSVTIPLSHLLGMLQEHLLPGTITPTWSINEEMIIFQIRLPRVVGAAMVGASLGIAGVLFQGLLRNPMADPYLIGTSAGAALGATIAMALPPVLMFFGFGMVPLLAFAGSLAAVIAVYRIARVGTGTPITTLLLTGFALSSFLTGIISFLMYLNQNLLRRIILWMMGGVSVSEWSQILIILPLMLAGWLVAYLHSQAMNVLLLGEEPAAHLGIDVERQKLILLALGALLTSASVSISGLIGFVGLVVPHVARLLLGPDHRLLFPASALAGGCFLVLADLIARSIISPLELPVGIVTALAGSPFFIYLLRQHKKVYTF